MSKQYLVIINSTFEGKKVLILSDDSELGAATQGKNWCGDYKGTTVVSVIPIEEFSGDITTLME